MNNEEYLEAKCKLMFEEIELLNHRINDLQLKNAELVKLNMSLKKQVSDYGWIVNPDRMGS